VVLQGAAQVKLLPTIMKIKAETPAVWMFMIAGSNGLA
jgi:hypothetical protein